MWIVLGRQPTVTDVKNGLSKYSLNSYMRHFGGWRPALEAFVEWVNDEEDNYNGTGMELDDDSIYDKYKRINNEEILIDNNTIRHRTIRDVGLKN